MFRSSHCHKKRCAHWLYLQGHKTSCVLMSFIRPCFVGNFNVILLCSHNHSNTVMVCYFEVLNVATRFLTRPLGFQGHGHQFKVNCQHEVKLRVIIVPIFNKMILCSHECCNRTWILCPEYLEQSLGFLGHGREMKVNVKVIHGVLKVIVNTCTVGNICVL